MLFDKETRQQSQELMAELGPGWLGYAMPMGLQMLFYGIRIAPGDDCWADSANIYNVLETLAAAARQDWEANGRQRLPNLPTVVLLGLDENDEMLPLNYLSELMSWRVLKPWPTIDAEWLLELSQRAKAAEKEALELGACDDGVEFEADDEDLQLEAPALAGIVALCSRRADLPAMIIHCHAHGLWTAESFAIESAELCMLINELYTAGLIDDLRDCPAMVWAINKVREFRKQEPIEMEE